MWRAQKTASGNTLLDNRNLPLGSSNWSPEYETRGLVIPWSGIWHVPVNIDYVKLYVRKINPHTDANGYWEFNNGSGVDCSGNANNGTFTNTVSSTEPGVVGQGLLLDGNNTMIVPDSNNLHFGEVGSTINFWMKAPKLTENDYDEIVMSKFIRDSGKTNGFRMTRSNNGFRVDYGYNDTKFGQFAVNGIPADGSWHMYTFTFYKGSDNFYHFNCFCDAKLVIDSVNSDNFLNSVFNNTAPLKVGNIQSGILPGINGVIDELSIYSHSLSLSQINTMYINALGQNKTTYDDNTVLKLSYNKNTIDTSGKKNIVTTSDGTVPVYSPHNDLYKSGIDFNGKSYTKVKNASHLNFGTSDFSISCWFKTNSTFINNTILDKRSNADTSPIGYHVCIYNGNEIVLQLADPANGWYNFRCIPSGITCNDGQWHQVIITVDRDNKQGLKFYVDGSLKGTYDPTIRMGNLDNSSDLMIGGHSSISQYYFTGSLDEVALYPKCLSSEEAGKIYNKKKWNVLVYMDGDCNLEGSMVRDVIRTEKGLKDDDLNVMVLMDRIAGGCSEPDASNDWTGAKLFKLRKSPHDPNNAYLMSSPCLKDYGEVNMGDPKTLEEFIVYCSTNYPAEHTLLIPSNHGVGINGLCLDDTNNYDYLTLSEFQSALASTRTKTGQKIDIISMNACLMQMMETLYQLRNEADFIQGAEETAGAYFIETIVSKIASNPSSTPETVAGFIYQQQYSKTDSCFRMGSSFETFISDFKNFATLLKNKSKYDDIKSSVDNVFRLSVNSYADLMDFVKRVSSNTTDPTVKAAANKLISSYQQCLLWFDICRGSASEAYIGAVPYLGNANGLSICLASGVVSKFKDGVLYDPTITGILSFTTDTDWDEFLYNYYTYIKGITDNFDSQLTGQVPTGYTVSGSTVEVSNKTLRILDSSTTTAVQASKTTTAGTNKTLECSIGAKNITNGIELSICSGSSANKVFNIKILPDGSIKYYNGTTWNALAKENTIKFDQWSRMELKAEGTTNARLFIDDICVGNLSNCGSYSTMDRFVISTSSLTGTGDEVCFDNIVF